MPTPDTSTTAYAVILCRDDGTLAVAPPGKTPECARQAVSLFEGANVFGLATIAIEREPISGMRYRLQPRPDIAALSATQPQQASAPVGVEGLAAELRERADAVVIANATGSEKIQLDEINKLLRCARDTAAALAQQPAAVDDATQPMSQEAAVELARKWAYCHHDKYSYLPQTAQEAQTWMPHEWVIDAIRWHAKPMPNDVARLVEAAKSIRLHHEGDLPVVRGIGELRMALVPFTAAQQGKEGES